MVANSSSGGGASSSKRDDVQDLLEKLQIRDEDFDDVVLDDEEEDQALVLQWLALARVSSARSYSKGVFERDMRSAWALAKGVDIGDMGENLFLLRFACLGDWQHMMEDGPWHFRKMAVIIAEYDGISKPSIVALDQLPICLQIHDLPPNYRTEKLVRALAGKVGEVLKLDDAAVPRGNFVRIKVNIRVDQPLRQLSSVIKGKSRQVYKNRFEKLPRFCAVCGLLGHSHLECGNGVHAPEDLVFEDWLRADPVWRPRPSSPRGRGGGRSLECDSYYAPNTYDAEDDEDMDLDPVAARDSSAKKRLALDGCKL
ncbi:uncharacterized protein LOC104582075 [Brachypodium distachyon]|uniref:uncharacterized protein LOC104582075 n=1 Tax=Brachypodium distachyon TaxID=15368 RepID=UPI0001C755B2|nr:uncharacterized protein LOC104582075 [Brachypodium distachyon]|eukprot:XP_010229680.1 uncharacterized protein LOC104582075 [Brachypodium distachyon]